MYSALITSVIRSTAVCVGHAACTEGKKRNAYKVLVRKPEGNNTTLKTQACMGWIILK
jgi:hypothetical protein